MKKTALALLLLIACSAPLLAQDWQPVKLPIDDPVTGICFVTPDTGLLATNLGTLEYTDDGGRTWKTHRVMAGAGLEDISFVNGSLGLVCGKRGLVYRTADGGQTWENVSPTVDSTVVYFSVRLFDKKNGLLAGMSINPDTPYQGIAYRTTDGGKTWIAVDKMGMGYSQIFYTPALGVYLPSFGQLHHSPDLGKTWQTQKVADEARARSLSFAGNTGMMAGPKGFFMVSHDGGKTWAVHKQDPNHTYVSVVVLDDKEAYMAGLNAVMMHTTDGGANWAPELLSRSFDVLDMQKVGNRLYAVGNNGGMVYKLLNK